MVDLWHPRDVEHRRFFIAEILGPLITATGPLDLRSAQAVDDAARAWILSLPEIPAPVLRDGVARLLRSCPAWMPKPEGLRKACAEVVAERHKALAPEAARLRAECAICHGSGWSEHIDTEGRSRGVAKCACEAQRLALYTDLPKPIALPPTAEETSTS